MIRGKKVYVAIPVQGARLSNSVYEQLSQVVSELGLLVTNPNVLEPPAKDVKAHYNPKDIYQENYSRLKASDLLIAEISSPSLGVGYEIATAQHLELPILCIYQSEFEKSVSLMILGIPYPKLQFVEYRTIAELKEKILDAIHDL